MLKDFLHDVYQSMVKVEKGLRNVRVPLLRCSSQIPLRLIHQQESEADQKSQTVYRLLLWNFKCHWLEFYCLRRHQDVLHCDQILSDQMCGSHIHSQQTSSQYIRIFRNNFCILKWMWQCLYSLFVNLDNDMCADLSFPAHYRQDGSIW